MGGNAGIFYAARFINVGAVMNWFDDRRMS
jgi:hypothetical protein